MSPQAMEAAAATRAVRRAGNWTAATVTSFGVLFALSSEVGQVRVSSPWAEDPYDLVVSIVALVLPVVVVVTWIRMQVWAEASVMPASPTRLALRGICVSLILMWAAVLTCLSASMTAAPTALPFAIGAASLALLTGISSVLALRAERSEDRSRRRGLDEATDAFDDLCMLLRRPRVLGVAIPPWMVRTFIHIAGMIEAAVASRWSPRRWRRAFPIVTALLFGVTAAAWHGLVEGSGGPLGGAVIGATYAVIGASVVLVVYATLGRYLRLVGPPH